MDTLQIVAMLVVFILLILFVYYFFVNDKSITTGLNDAKYYKYIDSKEFGVPPGLKSTFATSIWVYVNDWTTYEHTADRIIYYIGDREILKTSGSVGGPVAAAYITVEDLRQRAPRPRGGVVVMGLDHTNSTLKIHVGNDENIVALDGVAAADHELTFKIDDFPLQAWINVSVSVHNNAIDLYINGKLVSSKFVNGLNVTFPPQTENTIVSLGNPWLVFNSSDGDTDYTNLTMGFNGYTSKFRFYNDSLTPKQAYDIYKSGPGGSYLSEMIGDRSVDINFKNGQEVTSTISI